MQTMDSQGRNVIVCDNGTGVSVLAGKASDMCNLGLGTDNMKMNVLFLVRKVRICRKQLPSSHLSIDGRAAYDSRRKQDRRH